ncbi:transcription factor bHLH118-like [Cryptomeria japonica]|uniref:transcription factor bHLH118-like n=1 Tax=Cryptomeria japonica TaxID=3369 RepID=UPI0025AC0956|nr:transcription factor bHLH118-like [Cryptomeria japonica]
MGKNSGTIMSSKDIHKFVERRRRRDMKTLFSALRSLLPEEYVMGTCSTVEQLSESANYINHLHEKIKKLTQTRQEMRKEKLCRNLSFSVPSETCPIVRVSCHDWGVLVSTNTPKCQIVLSDLLLVLGNSGLDIVSAVACVMNDKVFHTIHAKIGELHSFDIKTSYQSIWNLVGKKTSDAKGLHK